jgi:GH24 family phage-related lysozyme (muramidase)
MLNELGVDPLAYNIGSNANKPRTLSSNILGSAYGGLIGLSGGGAIGMASHHLKQDEALSSLTKGINDFTRPGSSKWSKISSNTPIHSYIDSVGQPTIGWGSTYYDSILNGKKPVKSGDTITKGKADGILSTNIENLSKEYSSKIPHWNKMTDKQRAGLLVLGYNAPYGPIGAFKKLTKSLQDGDIRSAAQNLQRGGPNADRIALERNLLMSGPLNLKNLVGPKIVGEKKVGSGIPFIPPFMYNKQGGGAFGPNGKVLTNTGDKNPHSAADSRFVPLALHPDEYVKVFTKDFADRGGMKMVEYLQAMLDPDSNARKQGVLSRYNIEPPSQKGGIDMITLPPITQSLGGSGSSGSANRGSNVPGFSAVSGVAMATRNTNADLYGIV